MGFFLSAPSLQPLGFATFQCAQGAKRFGAKRFGARCIWGPKRDPINAVLLCEGRNWKRGRTWTNNRNKMGVFMQGIISGIPQRMKSESHSIISARVYQGVETSFIQARVFQGVETVGSAVILCLHTVETPSGEGMHLHFVPCLIPRLMHSVSHLLRVSSVSRVSCVLRLICSVSHLSRVSSVPHLALTRFSSVPNLKF